MFDLAASSLPLIEPVSAHRWTCPYFKLPFSLGRIITVNDYRTLSTPLLSRCPPLSMFHTLRASTLSGWAIVKGRRRDLSDTSLEATDEALTSAMKQDYQQHFRVVLRMLDLAEDLENRPMLH